MNTYCFPPSSSSKPLVLFHSLSHLILLLLLLLLTTTMCLLPLVETLSISSLVSPSNSSSSASKVLLTRSPSSSPLQQQRKRPRKNSRHNEKIGKTELLAKKKESWSYQHLRAEVPSAHTIDDMALRRQALATGQLPPFPSERRKTRVSTASTELFIGSEPTEYDDPNEVPFFGDENGYGNEETELRRSSGSHIPLDRPDPNLFSTPSSYRRLVQDLLNDTYYERTVHPRLDYLKSTRVNLSMSLYQILEVNERSQSIVVNVWMVQDWYDEFLDWDSREYGHINKIILPYREIWIPDTYLYNSETLEQKRTEALMNVIIINGQTTSGGQGAAVQLMFPAIYKLSCKMNVRFFPYDQQNCTFIISSWTRDSSTIDYHPKTESVNMRNFVPNSEWTVVSFDFVRVERSYKCCPKPWVMLYAHLVIRRKPLYYIINMVIPTSIITVVAVTGFFTPSSTSSERDEKLYLGINTLLTMSIMMMMVTNQMPNTSNYVPLMGWYYMGIIFVIVTGTLLATVVLFIHARKVYMRPLPLPIRRVLQKRVVWTLLLEPPASLVELWTEYGELPESRTDSANLLLDPRLLLRLPTDPLKFLTSFSSQLTGDGGSLNDQLMPMDQSATGSASLEPSSAALMPPSSAGPWDNHRHTLRYERRLASATKQCVDQIRRLSAGTRGRRRETIVEVADFLTRGDHPQPQEAQAQAHKRLAETRRRAIPMVGGGQNTRAVKRQKLMRRCALEWEFLANSIDRCLLILFSGITLGFFTVLSFFDRLFIIPH